jgi:hypothetical protein
MARHEADTGQPCPVSPARARSSDAVRLCVTRPHRGRDGPGTGPTAREFRRSIACPDAAGNPQRAAIGQQARTESSPTSPIGPFNGGHKRVFPPKDYRLSRRTAPVTPVERCSRYKRYNRRNFATGPAAFSIGMAPPVGVPSVV